LDGLKLENSELKAKVNSENEQLLKESVQKYKFKLIEYKNTINKQLAEIKTLKETVKEMQETNDFLTDQINNLNEQIYELTNTNKENASDLSNGFDRQAQKSSGVTPNAKQTSAFNTDFSSAKRLTTNNAINNQATPSNSNRDNVLNSLSSSVRRQNQCAQQ
jgi:hypothetical protein